MNNNKYTIWFYASLLPGIVAITGLTISILATIQGWGGERNLSTMVQVFFCEITFVVSVFGLVTLFKQDEKTALVKTIAGINIFLIASTLLLSIYFFLR